MSEETPVQRREICCAIMYRMSATSPGTASEMSSGEDDRIDDEAIVRGTFSMLDAWRRIRGPFIPSSGSELEKDDEDWPWLGVSQVAWTGFTVAVEHLQAIRTHIDVQPPNRPNLYAFAHQTLARTALVGAASAVWVLAPDDRAKRIERSRNIASYSQDENLKYLRALQKLAEDAGTDAVAEHVAMRQRELSEKREADGDRARYETTRIIREAALDVFGAQLIAEEVVAEWRSGSGAAHGLLHSIVGRSGMTQDGPADANGRAPFISGGDFGLFSNAYMAAYHVTHKAWELLERRGC